MAGKDKAVKRFAWGIALAWTAIHLLILSTATVSGGAFAFGQASWIPLFGFAFKALTAFQASRFFSQSRLDGSLELLLSTPLTTREILSGQLLALRNSLLWPAAIFIAGMYLPVLVRTGIALPFTSSAPGLELILTGLFCLRFASDLVAVALVGIWLSLSMKKPGFAAAATILSVLVLPSFLCWLDLLADFVFIAWAGTRLSRLDLRRYYF